MRAIVTLATAVLLAGPAVLPVLAAGTSSASMIEDSPGHYAFGPSAMTVVAGTTVTWTNTSDAPHTVTSDTGAFGSNPVAPSTSFRFTFSKAGTFNYHCSIHPYMHGAITVTAASVTGHATVAAPPAPVPGSMPATGAGGTALQTSGSGLAALLGLLILGVSGGVVTAFRRRPSCPGNSPS